MNFPNISNHSTNIFETITGALPIAPVKISGKYKVVWGIDNKLYLDDYENKRKEIDTTQKFIPQVLNFLYSPSILSNHNKLRYGGSSVTRDIKSWHVPLYINNNATLPDYFVLNQVLNDKITSDTLLHKYSTVRNIYDLDKIKFIFDEILNTENVSEFPFLFNLEEHFVTVFGHNIQTQTKSQLNVSITHSLANQPYFNVFNNFLLNSFEKNWMIWFRFINFEFEFKHSNNFKNVNFDNFYGFFSKSIDITENTVDHINYEKINLNVKPFFNKTIETTQIRNESQINIESYIDTNKTISFLKTKTKRAINTFEASRINIGDSIKIFHADGKLIFNYIVKVTDWKDTLSATLKSICKNFTLHTKNKYKITNNVGNNIRIEMNFIDKYSNAYYIEIPSLLKFISTKYFRSIEHTDIVLPTLSEPNTLITSILYDDTFYAVEEQFIYDTDVVLRLNSEFISTTLVGIIELYENRQTKVLTFTPITLYSYNSNFEILEQFNSDSYIANLNEKFGGITIPETLFVYDDVLLSYDGYYHSTDILPYYDRLTDSQVNKFDFESPINYNIDKCLSMKFNSPGTQTHLAPNLLNIASNFYENAGSVDYELLESDSYRFHWFLIKGIMPEYLSNDIRSLRYFDTTPKITSRLIKVSNLSVYCETIFLGVKYRLPVKYANYDFAVYLNPEAPTANIKYHYEIDNTKKTIYLVLNLYIDFVDLIRGGDNNEQPLIDLSLFYNIQESYNTQSESLFGFNNGGVLLCNDEIPVMWNGGVTKQWYQQDPITNKWYICLKRSMDIITPKFTELFKEGSDSSNFYVYSHIDFEGVTYDFISALFTVNNILIVKDDYIWVEDVTVKFFDTDTIFINKFELDGIDGIIKVLKPDIINVDVDVDDDFKATATIIVDGDEQFFKILNIEETFSIKKYYFELNRIVTHASDGDTDIVDGYFYFPDSIHDGDTITDLKTKYLKDGWDSTSKTQQVNLFDRHQIWNFIKSMMSNELLFKHNTSKQIKNHINQLLLTQLFEYSNLKSIEINNPEIPELSYVKMNVVNIDKSGVVWSDADGIKKISKLKRFQGHYLPYFKLIENEQKFYLDTKINTHRDIDSSNIMNIYDANYGGMNINATGIWGELQHNIVSSLYNKSTDIIAEIVFDKESPDNFDILDILSTMFDIDDITINNKNIDYITTIDSNVDEYILSSYCKWLLNNKYQLHQIKLDDYAFDFKSDTTDKYKVIITDIDYSDKKPLLLYTEYSFSDIKKLTFVFKIR